MDAKDRAYYLRRALQEQDAARIATCPEARDRHEELAAAYRFRCRMDSALGETEAQPAQEEAHCAA